MSAVLKARAAWGETVPDWVLALATRCDETSATHTAIQIGYSPAAVSQILSQTYAGRADRVETAVRAALMAESVDCPELGELSLTECLDWRAKGDDFQATSGLRTRMFAACAKCPLNGVGTGKLSKTDRQKASLANKEKQRGVREAERAERARERSEKVARISAGDWHRGVKPGQVDRE